ncbi:MAG: zf-TFIIB domain-containing protein [Gemmatimonadales bacterium]|jgi:hypothetical protein
MPDKPSRNEDEYFAKQSAELIKRRQAEQDSAEQAAARRMHYMKCPKCGGDLATQDYHGVQVDRCTECGGMWFDAGEVDDLLAREDAGVIKVLKSVMRGVSS